VGTLLHSCVKVRKPIEVLFVVLSGVGPGIGVLDGIHIPKGRGGFWVYFLSIGLNGIFERIGNGETYLTRV